MARTKKAEAKAAIKALLSPQLHAQMMAAIAQIIKGASERA